MYVRAFPSGEGKQRVSIRGGLEPQWRADGKELFYLSTDRNLMSVAVRPVDLGGSRRRRCSKHGCRTSSIRATPGISMW